jgi:hypothetical protein
VSPNDKAETFTLAGRLVVMAGDQIRQGSPPEIPFARSARLGDAALGAGAGITCCACVIL